eukprot:g18351.t1
MEESPYDSEKLLQEMLAKHPDLLAGEQINSDEPRRWLLVTREMTVQGEEDGAARWSLDHLFLDQDAVPTLVEVKKGANTDIRRKVIGQMLDYAANAVAYWPVEEVRAKFANRCEKNDEDPEELLTSHLDDDQEIGEFWQQVKTNLQAGRIRMVFLADSIPAELRRIVEFLNEQMDPAEVLAVEVKQFVGEGMTTLVPRVLGQSETARKKKGAGAKTGKQWDEPSFMAVVEERFGMAERKVAEELLHWITPLVTYVWWGSGSKDGGIVPVIQHGKTKHHICRMATQGVFVFRFDWLQKKPPFSDEAARRQLLAKINEIPDVHFGDEFLTKAARIPFAKLTTDGAVGKLKETVLWLIDRVKTERGGLKLFAAAGNRYVRGDDLIAAIQRVDQAGAEKWAGQLARKAKAANNVQLPYAIAETKGLDLRDWIVAGGTFEQLTALAESAPEASPAEFEAKEAADDPHRLARLIMNDHTHAGVLGLRFWRDAFYEWKGGAYSILSSNEMKAKITSRIRDEFAELNTELQEKFGDDAPPVMKVTGPLSTNVRHALLAMTLLPDSVEPPAWIREDSTCEPAGNTIATADSILYSDRIGSGEECTAPPTPALFSLNSLTYRYDSSAECPQWQAFLESLWQNSPDQISTLQEIMGYLATPTTAMQKVFCFIGPKRSGKSTIARVISALVGERNVCAPTLSSLQGDFGSQQLLGKSVATINDARLSGRADENAIIEKILAISGEDAQRRQSPGGSHQAKPVYEVRHGFCEFIASVPAHPFPPAAFPDRHIGPLITRIVRSRVSDGRLRAAVSLFEGWQMHDDIKVHVCTRKGRKNLALRYIDPITGKKTERSAGTSRRREAERAAAVWEDELRNGRYQAPSRILWSDFRERYESHLQATVCDATVGCFCRVFNVFERIVDPERLASVGRSQIQKFVETLRLEKKTTATIKSYLGHLKAAFRWAHSEGIMVEVPPLKPPSQKRNGKVIKQQESGGRPLVAEEFERMLLAVPRVVSAVPRKRRTQIILRIARAEMTDRGKADRLRVKLAELDRDAGVVVESWRHLVSGLYWSGLRISEAHLLSWDSDRYPCVDFSDEHPMIWIPGQYQKNGKDTRCPMAPEFAEFLMQTPKNQRTGFVFNPIVPRLSERPSLATFKRKVADFGRKASVKVKDMESGKVKHASAHDLRSSSGADEPTMSIFADNPTRILMTPAAIADYFINGPVLALTALAAIPIILHFLLRNKPKKLIFPALRLLQMRKKQNVRKMRLRHIWLLLLRILVILLLVFAIARPTLPSADYTPNMLETITILALVAVCAAVYFGVLFLWRRRQMPPHVFAYRRTILRGGTGGALALLLLLLFVWPYSNRVFAELTSPVSNSDRNLPVSAVYLFDCSLSMSYETGNDQQNERNTRLKVAAGIATRQHASFRTGSRVAVASTDGSGQVIFLTDREAIRSRINDLKINPLGKRTLDDLLRTAITRQKSEREKALQDFDSDRYLREIYIFTDLAKNGWDKKPSSRIRAELKELDWLQVYVIDVGIEKPTNAAIESLVLEQQAIRPGEQFKIDVKMTAVGEETIKGRLKLNLIDAAGRKTPRDQLPVELEPGAESEFSLSVRGLNAAFTQGTVEFEPAPDGSKAFTADDVRHFTVAVQPRPKVLIVSDSRSEAHIWQQSLAPETLPPLQRWFLCEYRPSPKLVEADLAGYDVVYLINVRSPTKEMWEKLEKFAKTGGGVGVILGVPNRDGRTLAAYDLPEARKILPARVEGRLSFIPPNNLYRVDKTHPAMALFEKFGTSEFERQAIYKYWKVESYPGSKVVLNYANYDDRPALVERRYGGGRVALMTTSVGGSGGWNELRFSGWAYVAFSHQLTQFLTGQASRVYNFEQGESVRLQFGGKHSARPAMLRKPRTQVRLTAEENDPGSERVLKLSDAQVDQIGNYQVLGADANASMISAFSLNVAGEQTDLTRMTKDDLDAVFGEDRYQVAHDTESLNRAVTAGRYGKEIFDLVVLLMIVAFCGELYVSNKFYDSEQSVEHQHMRAFDRRLLIGLRLATIGLIALAMFRPVLHIRSQEKNTRFVYILADSSRSMKTPDGVGTSGSNTRRQHLLKTLTDAREQLKQLGDDVEVQFLDFAETLEDVDQPADVTTGSQTDMAQALRELLQRTRGKNVLGVILMGDGAPRVLTADRNVDQRQFVLDAAGEYLERSVRVHTVPFGGKGIASESGDLIVENIRFNPNPYEGKVVTVQVTLRAIGAKNRRLTSTIRVEERGGVRPPIPGRMVDAKPTKTSKPRNNNIVPTGDDVVINRELSFVPDRPGKYKIAVNVEGLRDERNTANNTITRIIDVQTGGISVAYFDRRRTEQKFIGYVNASDKIQLDFFPINTGGGFGRATKIDPAVFKSGPGEYDVFIIGDVPARIFGRENLAALKARVKDGAGLMMTGGYDTFGPGGYAGTPLEEVLPVEMSVAEFNARQANPLSPNLQYNKQLQMIPTPLGLSRYVMRIDPGGKHADRWKQLAPLEGANRLRKKRTGNNRDENLIEVLATTPDGTPLLLSHVWSGARVMAFGADTTWQWYTHGQQVAHQRFWQQVILFLAGKDEGTEPVFVEIDNAGRRDFGIADSVPIKFGSRDEKGNLVAGLNYEIHITGPPIPGEDGKRVDEKITVAGGKLNNKRLLKPNKIPGEYWIQVTARKNDDKKSIVGTAWERFLVESTDLELDNPAPDPDLLKEIARVTGGTFVPKPDEFNDFLKRLAVPENKLEGTDPVTLWDTWPHLDSEGDRYIPGLLVLFVAFMSLEWFIRKRRGLAKSTPGGQPQFLYADKRIVDIPGFPDGITGEELSERTYRQARDALVQFRFNEELVDIEETDQVEKEDRLHRVITSHDSYLCRKVIVAFGLLHFPRKLPVLDELKSKKVHYKNPKIGDYEGQRVAVVGGGDSALDAAVMVLERHGDVNLLIREAELTGKAQTLQRVKQSGGTVHFSTEITAAEFAGDQIALTLTDGNQLLCDHVIVQIGFLSAKDTFERLRVRMNDDGSIAIDPYFETSRRGIFAVGDVHGDIKLIAVAWAEGIQAAIYAFKEITSPYWLNEKRLRDLKISLIGEKIAESAGKRPRTR